MPYADGRHRHDSDVNRDAVALDDLDNRQDLAAADRGLIAELPDHTRVADGRVLFDLGDHDLPSSVRMRPPRSQ